MRRTGWFRLAVGGVAAAAIVSAATLLPLREAILRFLETVRGFGPAGMIVLAAAYTPASLLLLPGALMTLGAGTLYHLGPGFVTVSLGSTTAAAVVFLVGRTLARGWVEQGFAHDPRFQLLDRAVAEQGFKIVLLTRLSPLFPFVLLNYAFSLTRVRFRDFVLASWVGMMPGTLFYVYLGSLLGNLSELGHAADSAEADVWKKVLFVLGLVATLAVTVILSRIAGRALRQALDTPGDRADGQNH